MLLEDKILSLAYGKDELLMMCQKWSVLKNDISEKLNTVSIYFPHFSLHNESHSRTICVQIGRLLGKERIEKLSFTDIYMMLLAFYMHDIGMALRYDEINEKFQTTEFKKYLHQLSDAGDSELSKVARRLQYFDGKIGDTEYDKSIDVYNDVILIIEDMYRKNHAKRSSYEIKNSINLEKNIGVRFVEILAEICEAHQKDINSIMNLPYKSNGLFDDYMHPRFIASMLCLGDLLDLDTDRFNQTLLDSVSPLPHNSKLHLLKHKSVKQFLVEPDKIEIISDSNEPEVYRIMREWTDWVKGTCDFLAINWGDIAPFDFGIAPRVTKCQLMLNGNNDWLQYSHIKFNISNKRAFEILKGSGIYKNKFVCIREIIQNAVDATLLLIFHANRFDSMKEHDILNGLMDINWNACKIAGKIYMNEHSNVNIEIRDYGIGLNKDDIAQISRVINAKSERKKDIIKKMPIWVRPSGAFGIGIHSIFQLTNKFQIITKAEDEKAKQITFESMDEMNGYITVQDFQEYFQQGTLIKFEIENDKIDLSDLLCSEYHYKTEKKAILILNKINDEYNNRFRNAPPFYEMKRQTFDFVPVEISIINPNNREEVLMINYDTIFTKNLNHININDNAINCRNFDIKNLCQFFCNIVLKNNEEHIYGDIKDMYLHKYGNNIFYRNVYVDSKVIEQFYLNNVAIYPYIDLKFNLLAETAEEVLEFNRNSIKENYEPRLKKIIDNGIKIIIESIIDRLLASKESGIGDIIFIMYQLSKYYNYKCNEILKQFKDIFENIKFSHYYSLEGNEEITFSFNDLCKQHLLFATEEIKECDFLTDEISRVEDVTNRCVLTLDKSKMESRSVHIINHRIEKMIIGKVNDKYYKVIEAVPFECNGSSIICYKDDIYILEDVISAIYSQWRCVNIVKEYMDLATPLKSKIGINKYGWFDSRSMIELPIEVNLLNEMKEELERCHYIKNANKKYYDLVIMSDKFEKNIRYIMEYNERPEDYIREMYLKFINKILELLEDEKYIGFNKGMMSWCEKQNHFTKGKNEYLEHNPYITITN